MVFWEISLTTFKQFNKACMFASSSGYGGYVEMYMNTLEKGDHMCRKEKGKTEILTCRSPDECTSSSPEADLEPTDLARLYHKKGTGSDP